MLKRASQRSEVIVEQVIRTGPRRRPPVLSTVAVLLLSAPVFALFVGCVYGAAVWLRSVPEKPEMVIPGAIALGIAWLLRPRLGRRPKEILTPAEAPVLFEVVDRIRKDLGGRAIHTIVIDEAFTASIGSYGLRGRRVLTLGAPFALMFTPLEIVGVIGHEFGHSRNRDPVRYRLVYSTVASLVALHKAAANAVIHAALAAPLMAAIVGVTRLMIAAIVRVTWRDRQLAELRADLGASVVAGSDATVRYLEKFVVLSETTEYIRSLCMRPEPKLHSEIRSTFRVMPADVVERVRRLMTSQRPLIDMIFSHPPERDRVAVVERAATRPPSSWLTSELLDSLDTELSRLAEGPLSAYIEQVRQEEMIRCGYHTPPWLLLPEETRRS